ncbi:hypothetical protein HYPSUDRAFT_63517 [Hypholoma sublateritium FD-334 SS-4]|uniref:Protein kinase domain-containing protein n=1 Tax=Hypholoma sublateritium (strain FD-334 SS-4) TaxID=945553 RepID=A0A0D2LGI6_HYPSF|nr:hypothetical protein HYPSUDRAFT_63517 [Hypholoma sublateritium FD-334 SS-4]
MLLAPSTNREHVPQMEPPAPFSDRPRSRATSVASQAIEDVLAPGDVVGDGCFLQGEQIRTVAAAHQPHAPAQEFEVIKQLGPGNYTVVYLVHEVLARPPPSEDGHMSTIGAMEFNQPRPGVVYGRKYAIKCLSKADLDEDVLAVQMSEITIHQSLHLHSNTISLHRTLETFSFFLLLLEYVPGEDLFYFRTGRDHYDLDHTDSSVATSHTPPTPNLLSNLNPSQLLSRIRLRLISSMFSQMCDAVAACHALGVFHRDIKPENFIVADGHCTTPDGRSERKSADMDCGSGPYMSYECRNNLPPTYRPRAADVWSLRIVLVNMLLYHFNPWTDTVDGACSSFEIFLKDPVAFFMQRFVGMTRPVADVLAHCVFCILDSPHDDRPRMSAAELGAWARILPSLLAIPPRSLSRALSFERAELSTVIDQGDEDDAEENENDNDGDVEGDVEIEIEGMTSRSTSTNKRRKRGARKGRGAAAAVSFLPASPTSPFDATLAALANASQSLAREISMASKSSSHRSGSASRPHMPFEPVSMYPLPTQLLSCTPSQPAVAVPEPIPAPVTKKQSKWKLSFGKNSATTLAANAATAAAAASVAHSHSRAMASTANNVATLLMGLNAPNPHARSLHSLQHPLPPHPMPGMPTPEPWAAGGGAPRGQSPPGAQRASRALASSASSVISANWRSSMSTASSAGTLTSAFTRYSNSSARSVSTTATSVSSASWRTSVKQGPGSTFSGASGTGYAQGNIPKNIKKTLKIVPRRLARMPPRSSAHAYAEVFAKSRRRLRATRRRS